MASAMAGMLGGGAENPATLWASETVAVNGQDVGPLGLSLRDGLTIEGSIVVEGGGAPPDAAAFRIGVSKPASGDPATAMLSRATGSSTGVQYGAPSGPYTRSLKTTPVRGARRRFSSSISRKHTIPSTGTSSGRSWPLGRGVTPAF